MKAPPFIVVALAIAIWAGATGRVGAAAVALAALALPRWWRARRVFERSDHERIADLCAIAFLGLMTWQWLGDRSRFSDGVLGVLTWLPGVWAPVLLLQAWSAHGSTPLSALFWSLRRGSAAALGERRIAFEWPWVGLCLLGAACANPTGHGFFVAVVALAALARITAGPPVRAPLRLAVTIACVGAAAWGLQQGMAAAQARIEIAALDWLRARVAGPVDPARSQTAIGALGRLELSGEILWRVGPQAVRGVRLRDATYDVFAYDTWFSQTPDFRPARPEGDASWVLAPGSGDAIEIAGTLARGRALLPLPQGTRRLDALNVGEVDHASLGAVRVARGPDVIAFRAVADPTAPAADSAPRVFDLAIPSRLRPTVDAALREAVGGSAEALAPAEVAARVVRHFATRYAYALRLESPDGTRRTLERFLTSDRRGHCEYFASATALLLRAAGIPTRYATGYVVDEWSALEARWVVRARHGHAWTLAWWDGRWHEVDATPTGWIERESADAGAWRAIADFAAWARFAWAQRGARADAAGTDGALDRRWLWLVLPLGGWVAASVWRRSRRADATPPGSRRPAPPPPGPGWVRLFDAVARHAGTRDPAEPVHRWLARAAVLWPSSASALEAVARDARALRYDPLLENDAAAQRAGDTAAAALAERLSRTAPGPEPATPAAPVPRR